MIRARLPFALVDVFARTPLAGNPLAVVLADSGLDETVMRRLAREFNLAETTIVLPARRASASRRLRSFTPAGFEIFGAGHNALGAWWWLADRGEIELPEAQNYFRQELGKDVLGVQIAAARRRPKTITLAQARPRPGAMPDDLGALAQALGIERDEIDEEHVPAQVVSTGDAHLMLPLRHRHIVDSVHVEPRALFAILQELGCEGCYIFNLRSTLTGAAAYARFFNPTDGLWEDPASGGAAGPLAWHLYTHGRVRAKETILVEQGTALGRKSIIEARVTGSEVQIAGSAVVVGKGILSL